jgi:hypothetical protein
MPSGPGGVARNSTISDAAIMRGLVGRTSWSATLAPVGELAPYLILMSLAGQRDEGVPRRPGGLPHHVGEKLVRDA